MDKSARNQSGATMAWTWLTDDPDYTPHLNALSNGHEAIWKGATFAVCKYLKELNRECTESELERLVQTHMMRRLGLEHLVLVSEDAFYECAFDKGYRWNERNDL